MTTNVVETESTTAVVTENDLTSVVEVTSAGPAGPPGGALTIQDEGVDEGLLTDKINFAGSTVSVVNDTVNEIATVTVDAADPGANTNITSLGGITGGISSPDYVQFDTAAAAAGAVGRLLWNDTDGTLEFQLKGGNVTLQIGQEEVIRVTNTAGVTMTDGQAVYITGSTGNHLNVTLAQANAEATSSKTLAVVTETIANNNTGFATSSGLVRGLNTSALTEGAAIWLSPTVPGGLTSTKPVAPNHAVLIGWCVRQHASVGVIYVHIANGYELEELHNVLITAAANNQVLRYDAEAGLWKNATISPTLTLTGDVSGSATFTDLGNATLTATVADDSHNHIISNVDGLQDALDSKLPAASYTAADVLTKIKTVDGTGSGLDADLLDGQDGSYYLDFTNATNKPDPTITLAGDATGSVTLTDLTSGTLNVTVVDDSHNHVIANVDGLQDALDSKLAAANYTATDVLDKIKTVDGAGSGLDADLLDGQSSAYYTAINDRLGYTAENAANKGIAGGYASLDVAGLVPATQLPSYVDDVLEFANLAAFPVTGETGKIYVAVDTAKTYRWSGSTYVEISASPGSTDAVPEGSSNLYFTTARARQSISAAGSLAYDNSTGVMSFTDAVTSVAGRTGDITLSTSDVSEGTNLYFTNARARSAIGASGSLTYDSATGVVSYTTPNTDGIVEGTANLYHTTARARGAVSAGTGISYNSSTGVITNAAPDQTVAITGVGTTTVSGTYPNFTVSSADQYVGTVTSVSGTGTVNGLTLTGTVTSSGSLTLGGTLSVDLSTSTVTGTLPASNGGTGTTTQFTAGSVVFAGASGVYSQDNANLFWDDTNNRLGIGTTTPGRSIAVKGGIAFDDANTTSRSVHWGDGTTYPVLVQGDATSGFLAFQTNTAGNAGTERMRIDSAGNVGIGTSSPAAKLDVKGLVRSSIGTGTGAGGAGYAFYQFGTSATATENWHIGTEGDGSFRFYNQGLGAGLERMRIDSSGNVGIGTSSPTSRLTITGGTTEIRDGNYLMLRPSGNGWDMRLQATGTQLDILSGGALGSPIMSLVNGGNVGIGTSSPTQKLDVTTAGGDDGIALNNSSAAGGRIRLNSAGTGGRNYHINSTANGSGYGGGKFVISDSTAADAARLVIDSSGNVGIGNSNPTTKLWVGSSGSGFGTATPDAISLGNTFANSPGDPAKTKLRLFQDNTPVYYGFGVSSGLMETHVPDNAAMAWYTGGSERMRIDSSGNVGVGTTTNAANPGIWLDKNGTLAVGNNAQATGWGFVYFNRSGTSIGSITQNGTTAVLYNTTSDARLKENIAPADDAAALIDAIQVRKFDWKADGSHQRYGMVAQELLEVAPEAVSVPADEDQMMGVDYSKLVPMLIKEVQSLRARVAQLEGN